MQLKRQKLHYKDNLKQIQDNVFKTQLYKMFLYLAFIQSRSPLRLTAFKSQTWLRRHTYKLEANSFT